MKIAFLSTFYPFRGGIAQFSGAMFRSLEINHHVKAFNFKRQYPQILFPGETQFVKDDDVADAISTERILDSINPISFVKTAKAINNFNPEIFISSYWMTFFSPSMGSVAKKLNPAIKKIAILHNVKPHEKRFFDKLATRYFLNNHDGYVVLSDAVEKDLLEIHPKAKVLQLKHPNYNHFGAKINQKEAIETLGLDVEKKTILFFGIIRDYKGLDVLLDAFGGLNDQFQLIIAGECYGLFEKYNLQIEKNKNKNRIKLHLKYISDQEVATFFSAADVCILPYKSATQSGITAISHHFCVPIIATDVGGLKETIKNGENGLIVESAETEKIKFAIEKYFKEALKSKFEEKLTEENEENSWTNFTNKIIDFASEIAVNTMD
jgi:glycosyltransferase involved in cell wall biosynthesis